MHIVINYECVFFASHSFVPFRSNVSIHWFHLIFRNAATIWTAWINKKIIVFAFLLSHWYRYGNMIARIWNDYVKFRVEFSSSAKHQTNEFFVTFFFLRRKWFFFSSMLRKSRTFEFMSQFSAYKLNISIMIRDWIFLKMHLVSDKIRENTPNDFQASNINRLLAAGPPLASFKSI